jgi:hypothetical protein
MNVKVFKRPKNQKMCVARSCQKRILYLRCTSAALHMQDGSRTLSNIPEGDTSPVLFAIFYPLWSPGFVGLSLRFWFVIFLAVVAFASRLSLW